MVTFVCLLFDLRMSPVCLQREHSCSVMLISYCSELQGKCSHYTPLDQEVLLTCHSRNTQVQVMMLIRTALHLGASVFNVIGCTCAFSAMTGENVCCEKRSL